MISEIFKNVADREGWTPATQVAVLLNFLESEDMPYSTEGDLA